MINKVVKSLVAMFCILITTTYAENANRSSLNLEEDSFQTVDKHASNLIRVDAHANWAGYQVYRFAPAVYEPSSSRHQLKPGEILKVDSILDRSLQKSFKNSIKAEGPVLEVRPIITSLGRTNTVLNALGLAAIQTPISFGSATVRYELLDGISGDKIGVISCKRNARPWNVYPWNVLYNFEAVGQGSVILKNDSIRLRKDLELLGKFRPAPNQDALVGAE